MKFIMESTTNFQILDKDIDENHINNSKLPPQIDILVIMLWVPSTYQR